MDYPLLVARSRGSSSRFVVLPQRKLSLRLQCICSVAVQKHGSRSIFKSLRSSKNIPKQKLRESKIPLKSMDYQHIQWWQEKMLLCKKATTRELIKRLSHSNILGLNEDRRNGRIKDGSLNSELVEVKRKFPHEVLLCRVGEFYEAVGFDACILVEYAGLNPMGGIRGDSVPKAGCPVMNLRQTLDDLTKNGFSVCVFEELNSGNHAGRKERFISGHAHPGSPYVYGLAGADIDVDFSEPVPVIGISRSARGYCFVSVLEAMQTYSAEDGLTEEAVVAKLRAHQFHSLFLHTSLKKNLSGGLLWCECSGKHFEWISGDPISELLCKVKEIYGLDSEKDFRNITPPPDKRPRSLYLGTATHIGIIHTEGIPSLLSVLLPTDIPSVCSRYLKELLLNPPPYSTASCIRAASRQMSEVTCAIPDFTCVPAAKLVKLIGAQEMNHMEFWRIRNMAEDVIQMYEEKELRGIFENLLDPTSLSTGLNIHTETLIEKCRNIANMIGDIIVLEGELDEPISSFENIPDEFFLDKESSWRGRVKRVHVEDVLLEVSEAAKALYMAIEEDFVPILSRIKALSCTVVGEPKGEISYHRDCESVWFKGKRFVPSVWANTIGEEQIKKLIPATDSKGKRVGADWHTTEKVEKALNRYRDAVDEARLTVTRVLKGLASEMQHELNSVVFISVLSIISKTLFSHVREGIRRNWVFPTVLEARGHNNVKDPQILETQLEIQGLLPFWIDPLKVAAVQNNIQMHSLFLLTGPNGGGKSSLLRSLGATALLAICGLMVPAESATIPHFDSILIQMGSYDSPSDGKSSFQIEMSEIRSILSGATSRSLVLIDEICRGTEVAKGTCIAASIIEKLDSLGCMGIVSTHLHGLLDLSMQTKRVVYKAMGTKLENNQIKPTWKLVDGVCRESLAFETAQHEGVPEGILKRAEELYMLMKDEHAQTNMKRRKNRNDHSGLVERQIPRRESVSYSGADAVLEDRATLSKTDNVSSNSSPCLQEDTCNDSKGYAFRHLKEASEVFMKACKERLMEYRNKHSTLESSCAEKISCLSIGAREQPPPSLTNCSCVYILQRPDGKLYVGETDDLAGRINAHRTVFGLQAIPFIYTKVPGKSVARELETITINRLLQSGFQLVNKGDQVHQKFGTDHLTLPALPF
eukprot:TRINITY_DN9073_c0_g1_i2.p1 TRINITY_DN9073_c0_g1~~TRINITY_DN9073_c0_g1_i2.p1  ORF type:complete len:1166 (-),score=225.50 TRINITY_DN9073_c0_g1_i2:15-3476(-)